MPKAAARRVFISYRTSDGADKATALARELGARIGDANVFLDKDDLSAGGRWRDEIALEVAAKPIVLALLTPRYLDAVDAGGRRRIDSPDDPVRAEWQAAIDAGAHVIPLLADGVESLPPAADLPATFAPLHERTWRRLRAYDWAEDIERLVGDLAALGVAVCGGAGATRSRRTAIVAAVAIAAVVLAVGGTVAWLRHDAAREREAVAASAAARERAAAADAASAAARRRDLSGRWHAELGAPSIAAPGAIAVSIVATWRIDGDRVRFASEPIDIAADSQWRNHRDYWKARSGLDLARVVWRGEGRIVAADDAPRKVEIAVHLYPEGSDEWLLRGGLFGTVEPDGERIRGRAWLSGERGERSLALTRLR